MYYSPCQRLFDIVQRKSRIHHLFTLFLVYESAYKVRRNHKYSKEHPKLLIRISQYLEITKRVPNISSRHSFYFMFHLFSVGKWKVSETILVLFNYKFWTISNIETLIFVSSCMWKFFYWNTWTQIERKKMKTNLECNFAYKKLIH